MFNWLSNLIWGNNEMAKPSEKTVYQRHLLMRQIRTVNRNKLLRHYKISNKSL